MKEFSENMEFERAIREREKIVSLKKLLQNQVIEYSKEIDEDVFVIDQIGEKSFICVLDIREGKIINKNHIYVNAIFFSLIFNALSPINILFYRVGSYFYIYSILYC